MLHNPQKVLLPLCYGAAFISCFWVCSARAEKVNPDAVKIKQLVCSSPAKTSAADSCTHVSVAKLRSKVAQTLSRILYANAGKIGTVSVELGELRVTLQTPPGTFIQGWTEVFTTSAIFTDESRRQEVFVRVEAIGKDTKANPAQAIAAELVAKYVTVERSALHVLVANPAVK